MQARDRGRKPGTPMDQSLDMPGTAEGWLDVQSDQRDDRRRNPGSLLVPDGAGWVAHDTLGVAEEVAARWPNLRIAQCEQRCRDCAAQGHYPYVVIELTRSGRSVVVLGLERLDRSVIDTLWSISEAAGDQQKLADEHNARVREAIARRRDESRRARLEVVESALRSRKKRWRGPGGVVIDRDTSPADLRRAMDLGAT